MRHHAVGTTRCRIHFEGNSAPEDMTCAAGLSRLRRRTATAVLAAAIALSAALVPAVSPAQATPAPVAQETAGMVTATALPTTQIDGVVWSQAMVGNAVYAGGSFANARPAGAAPGTQLTPRSNLLSYDVTTGALNTSFAPVLNQQVLAVAKSPDGSRIYVGGDFTTADNVTHNRLAAYSTSTGQLIASFAPNVNAQIKAIVATNSTVYFGGTFGYVNGVARSRLAAVNAVDGSLTGWAPAADAVVDALTLTPSGAAVIAGGAFATINGTTVYGLAALDAITGSLKPWAANQSVRNYGSTSAILSLTTDGTSIYGTGYSFHTLNPDRVLEGAFSANPDTGVINWIESCHGDTYGAFANAAAVYVVSHEHDCATVGAFAGGATNAAWYRSTAFSVAATGTLNAERLAKYSNFAGQPSPTQYNWYPNLAAGSVTGMIQAAWSVTGNDQYVVEGGEFPSVNGVGQQGLVRFAVPSVQPDKVGPVIGGAALTPSAVALSTSSVRLSWTANYDLDDQNLNYSLMRSDRFPTPVYTTTAVSRFWDRPTMSFVDSGLTAGASYTYYLKVADPAGNKASSVSVTITVPTSGPPTSAYYRDVVAAAPTAYWRLGESAGVVGLDATGRSNLALKGTVTRAVSGAIAGDTDTATQFDGKTAFAATSGRITAPTTFTVSAFFSTTCTTGGKIIGFGDKWDTTTSYVNDRTIYMDTTGHLYFGVVNGTTRGSVKSANAYNDGTYHQVVATLSAAGMALYVDGQAVATNAALTSATTYPGYWHVGGDTAWTGSKYFAGTIDEVAIYNGALSPAQIRGQYVDSGLTLPGTAPSTSAG